MFAGLEVGGETTTGEWRGWKNCVAGADRDDTALVLGARVEGFWCAMTETKRHMGRDGFCSVVCDNRPCERPLSGLPRGGGAV